MRRRLREALEAYVKWHFDVDRRASLSANAPASSASGHSRCKADGLCDPDAHATNAANAAHLFGVLRDAKERGKMSAPEPSSRRERSKTRC